MAAEPYVLRFWTRVVNVLPTLKRWVALIALGACGCESVISPDLASHEPQLVAISYFSPQNPWSVVVRHSVGLGDQVGVSTAVTDALVEIYRENALEVRLHHRGEGVYASDGSRPEPGVAYTLRVSSERYGTLTATDAVPAEGPVPQFTFADGQDRPTDVRPRARIEARITDPVDEKNYYRLDVLADYGAGPQAIEYESDDPVFRVGSGELNRQDGFRAALRVFDDAIFDGESYAVRVEFPRWPANSYSVAVVRLSEAYFRYARSLERISDSRSNPFLDPIAPRSNVHGGQGVFAGYSLTRSDPVVLGEITAETISGDYRMGAFARWDSGTLVPMESSAALELELAPTGKLSGRLYAPAWLDANDPERAVDVYFTGTFEYDGRHVTFVTNPATFLQDAPWLYRQGLLTTSEEHGRFFVSMRQAPR